MRNRYGNQRAFFLRSALTIATAIVATAVMSVQSLAMTEGSAKAKRPAAEEFGLGPRTSSSGTYVATLAPVEPLRKRKLQTVRVRISDREGRAIDDATITIDGGMPEHRHGLPTRPRVTKMLGDGVYEIEGVRFNMGGWWEFKVLVTTARGAETITFNLAL